MEILSKKETRLYDGTLMTKICFLNAESVTIFEDGIWNYDDFANPDPNCYRGGSFFLDGQGRCWVIDSSDKEVPFAVYEALRELKYNVVEPKAKKS